MQNLTKQKVGRCEGKLPEGFINFTASVLPTLLSSIVFLLVCHPNYSLVTCISDFMQYVLYVGLPLCSGAPLLVFLM